MWWRLAAGGAVGVGAGVGAGVAWADAVGDGADEADGGPLGDPGVRAASDALGVGVSAPHAARNSATPPASDAPRNRRRVTMGPA